MPLHPVLLERLNQAVAPAPPAVFTRRDVRLPALAGKVHAVIGMRRAGKTTFLRQLEANRRMTLPPERAVFLSLDDDRLEPLGVEQLGLLLEEYYRRYPGLRGTETVHWFLDEVQCVVGWERFARRVLDTERMELVVSGSSARMLSREVHTSLRGRGLETVIRPFSFREFLRHRGEEPDAEPARFTAARRSLIENRFLAFLEEGGFPEAQGLPADLRTELLQGYVNSVLFRDVVERYQVRQVAALRWLTRFCLRNPAGCLSVHRLAGDLRSQGHGVAKDAVHAMFEHLMDAFLISTVPLFTESERRRNSNPRKIYPVDAALAGAFSVSGRPDRGHLLETVVFNELARRGAEVTYVRTAGGHEVDFHALYRDGRRELIQVCADPSAGAAAGRELRAIEEASGEHPGAAPLLLVMTREQVAEVRLSRVRVEPAHEWLLREPGRAAGSPTAR